MAADLGIEVADPLGDRDEGSQKRHRLGQRNRRVEGKTRVAALEHGDHLVGDLERHTDLRFLRRGAEVRRHDDLR